MDTVVLVALIGGAGGILSGISVLVKFIYEALRQKRGDTLESHLAPIMQRLEAQEQELHEIRLDTLRTQLYIKMEHEPHNHDTILTIAHRYFVDYGGDWVATTDFQNWANKERITIPHAITIAIAENDKKA